MNDDPTPKVGAPNAAGDPEEALLPALRRSALPLNAQLARVSKLIEESYPHYARAYDQLIARLRRAQAGGTAPQQGEQMPEFLLPDNSGHLVSLAQLRGDGPVVVAFLRGHWCPYCRLNAAALADVATSIKPAQIVAISADTAKYSKKLRDDSGASFPFLTDVGNGYAMMLGLSFALGEELAAMLGADACDIPAFHGTESWVLPIPATFVVGSDGFITARYVNPDFRQRMEIDALRSAVALASAGDGGPIGSP